MSKHSTIVQISNREPTGLSANPLLLVLVVAAFALGVAMVSQGVLPSRPAAQVAPTTHAARGWVASVAPEWDERPVTTTPPADRVWPTPVTSIASSGEARIVAACTPRLSLDCDLRLGLMDLALQQRGLFLGQSVAPDEQHVPTKYCVLARAEGSAARTASSPSDVYDRKIQAVDRGGAPPRKTPCHVG